MPATCFPPAVALGSSFDADLVGLQEVVTYSTFLSNGTPFPLPEYGLPINFLETLLAELAHIRDRGLGFDNCESNRDVRCVAAPVRDASGQVAAGLSISVPAHRADRLEDELATYAAEGARRLSARLGFRPQGAAS